MNTMRQMSGRGLEVPVSIARRAGLGICAAALIIGSLTACGGGNAQPSGQQDYDTEVVFGDSSASTTTAPATTASLPPMTTSPSRESSRTSSIATTSASPSSAPRTTNTSPSGTPTSLGPVVVNTVPLNPTETSSTSATTTKPGTSAPTSSPENNQPTGLSDQATAIAGRLSQFVSSGEAIVKPAPPNVERTDKKTIYIVSKALRAGSQLPEVTAQVFYAGTKITGVDLETGNDIILPGENSDELNRTHLNSDESISLDDGLDGSSWTGSVYLGHDFYETPHATPPDGTNMNNVTLHDISANDIPLYSTTLLDKF